MIQYISIKTNQLLNLNLMKNISKKFLKDINQLNIISTKKVILNYSNYILQNKENREKQIEKNLHRWCLSNKNKTKYEKNYPFQKLIIVSYNKLFFTPIALNFKFIFCNSQDTTAISLINISSFL